MVNYGERYYEHYRKYLGEPIDREVYVNNPNLPKIQILKYENVFEECLVYSTLGFSKYEEVVGSNIEVTMVVDGAFQSSGSILANTLFYCIDHQFEMGRGIAISGIENVDREFVDKYHKSAIYLTDPFAFPEDYSFVLSGSDENDGRILLAFFINQSEYEFFSKYGADKFEDLLEEKNVDPFHVNRVSII